MVKNNMKLITSLFLFFVCSVCSSCSYTVNGPKSSSNPIISTDLFEKAWDYHLNNKYTKKIILDTDNNHVVLITQEKEWYVLDRKSGSFLCGNQSRSSPDILGLNHDIFVRIEDDIIFMIDEGGNDIFVYNLIDCSSLAEIHLNDLSYICDYTIDFLEENIVVLNYDGASAFNSFSGDLVWEIKDDSIASQRTCGLLKTFENYLFIEGEGKIHSIDPKTGLDLFSINSPSDNIYFRGGYMGIDNLFLVKGASVDNIQDQFIVALNAKTGEVLFKASIPSDEYFKFYPIQIVNGRKLLYGDRFASVNDNPGFCDLYEIEESEIRFLWQNEGMCSNGLFFDKWLVARPYPEPAADSKYSSTFYMLDVFTGEVVREQKFNMHGVTSLYSDDEYLYFLRDHDLTVYKLVE